LRPRIRFLAIERVSGNAIPTTEVGFAMLAGEGLKHKLLLRGEKKVAYGGQISLFQSTIA